MLLCSGEPDVKLETNLDITEDEVLPGGIETEFTDSLSGKQDQIQTDADVDSQPVPSFTKCVIMICFVFF